MAQKARKIWEKGVSLNNAWLAFANEKSKAEFKAAFQPQNSDLNTDKSLIIAFSRVTDAFLGRRPEEERRNHLRDAMRTNLVDWLLHEDLHAYGFPVRRPSIRTPRRIRAEFWDNPDINWEKGIARDADSAFQRIRIVDPRDFPEFELKPKPGRKTHKPIIYRAVREIVEDCPNFGNLSNKERAELVREFIKKRNPDLDPYNGKGFGNDALRKNINSCLKEIKFNNVGLFVRLSTLTHLPSTCQP